MMDKPYIEIGGEYHDCVILNEYKGELSLCSGNARGDDVFMRWCFPQAKDREPGKKSIPWKVTIGESKEQAIETLKWAIAQLGGGEEEAPQDSSHEDRPDWAEGPPPDEGPGPEDDDIPF